jgi:hypothetical protein
MKAFHGDILCARSEATIHTFRFKAWLFTVDTEFVTFDVSQERRPV